MTESEHAGLFIAAQPDGAVLYSKLTAQNQACAYYVDIDHDEVGRICATIEGYSDNDVNGTPRAEWLLPHVRQLALDYAPQALLGRTLTPTDQP